MFHDYSLKFSLRPFEVGEVKGDEEVFWFNYFRVRLKFYVGVYSIAIPVVEFSREGYKIRKVFG